MQRWAWVTSVKDRLDEQVSNAAGFVGRPDDTEVDAEGHVSPYWVLHVGAGTPGVESDLAQTAIDAGMWAQVTCVAAFDRDVFALVDRVHTALYRWTPPVPGAVAEMLKPPPGFDPGPPRLDQNVKPNRLWVPLQYAGALTYS